MQSPKGPIGSLIPGKSIRIYGAGVSGLLMGYYLKKAGHKDIQIFESTSKVGGKIQSLKHERGTVETAANALYTNDDVFKLLKSLKLQPIKANEGLKKKVWRHYKAKSIPVTILEVVGIIFKIFRKCPELSDPHLTVYEFFSPWLGKKVAYELLSAGLGGIYANDSKELHFQSVFKLDKSPKNYFEFIKLMKAKRAGSKTKATSISFKGGMQDFIDALSNNLSDELILNESPSLSKEFNNIICTDAHDASNLINSIAPELSQILNTIEYESLQTSTYFYDSPIDELDNSFGILFPPGQTHNVMGILNNSAIFSRKKYSYTFITKSETPDVDINECLMDLKFQTAEVGSHTTPWTRAIPVYNEERYQSILQLRSKMLDTPGLILFGNYIDGISIREMVSLSKNFVR